MYLTWKRNAQGIYEGCTKTFNYETGKHEPIFTIVKIVDALGLTSGWRLFVKGEVHVIATDVGFGKTFNITLFSKLKDAKRTAQRLEDENPPYRTDEDIGMAHAHYAPGQEISCYITAERIGGRLYVSDDGQAIISETRYPDGRIVTERREYGAVNGRV